MQYINKIIFKKFIILQLFIISIFTSFNFAYSNSGKNISVALKTGFSFNKATEHGLQKLGMPVASKTSATNSAVIDIDFIFPFTNKLSGVISGIFMPKHNLKSSGSISPDAQFYLNSSVSSYGFMGGLNYNIYEYNRISQYIIAKAGLILNRIDNSTLILEEGRSNPASTINFFHYDKLNFAWQIGTGIKYAISNTVSLGLEYAYLDRGKAVTKGGSDLTIYHDEGTQLTLLESSDRVRIKHLTSHQILLGIECSI